MKKILLYVEPHPIRDSYEEFCTIGMFLANSIYEKADVNDSSLRIFSNNHVVDRIVSSSPKLSSLCIRPSIKESISIEEFGRSWGAPTINEWVSLTRGVGEVSEFYEEVLERIHDFYSFDIVLLWSENGAVRNFCARKKLKVIHGELGPTRLPFEETIYFDFLGTNGNASVVNADLNAINIDDVLPAETWIAAKGRNENNPEGLGIVDSPYTFVLDDYTASLSNPYVFLPLQLADDLNTIEHSSFKSPSDFVEKVLPVILKQGYRVVIKPHPGAVHRAFNLSAEAKALKIARSYGKEVVVLDRDVSISRSLRIINEAEFVFTINSSVGYEALLMGKRVILLGYAAYDVGRKLYREVNELENLEILEFDVSYRDKLVNFLSGYYLQPKSKVLEGDVIFSIIDFVYKNEGLECSSKEFWNAWVAQIKYGIDYIYEAKEVRKDGAHEPVAGNIALLKSKNLKINDRSENFQFSCSLNGKDYFAEASSHDSYFFGFIDSLEMVKEDCLKISGWALDKNLIPPVAIYIACGNEILSRHRLVVPRPDVLAAFRNTHLKGLDKVPIDKFGFNFETRVSNKNINEVSILILSEDNKMTEIPLSQGSIHKEFF